MITTILLSIAALYLLAGIAFYCATTFWYRDIELFVPCKLNEKGRLVPIIPLWNWVWAIILTIIWFPWVFYLIRSNIRL